MIKDYWITAEVFRRFPSITPRQIVWWVEKDVIVPREKHVGSGVDREFHWTEVQRIGYMDILVNQLGFKPIPAGKIATELMELKEVRRGYTWVNVDGVYIGCPIVTL